MNLHAPFFQNHFQILGNLFIQIRYQPGHGLQNRNLTAQGGVNRGEFHTDNPASDNHQTLRSFCQPKQFITGEHSRQIHPRKGQHHRHGACSQNDVFRPVHFGSFFGSDLHLAVCQQHSLSGNQGHSVSFQELFHPLHQLFRGLFFIGKHFPVIKGYVLRPHTEDFPVFCLLIQRRGVNHCFRRNTASVQAGSSHLPLLYNRGLQAQLRRLNCGHVAARPGSQNYQIKCFSHFVTSTVLPPLSSLPYQQAESVRSLLLPAGF